jgi:Family of unknown function (DUF5832)
MPSRAKESVQSQRPRIAKVKERSWLEADPEINGQKYACVSFVSPEDVLLKKDAFLFNRYLSTFAADMQSFFDNTIAMTKDSDPSICTRLRSIRENHAHVFDAKALHGAYDFFMETNSKALEDEFYKANGNATSIRGIKLRGTYASIDEAKNRAKKIMRFDKNFHVYVMSVGFWCPWSPVHEDIEDVEYADDTLNTLVKTYTETREDSQLYHKQRQEFMQSINGAVKNSDPKIAELRETMSSIEKDVDISAVRAEYVQQMKALDKEQEQELVQDNAP